MKIEMKTLQAGPGGVRRPGRVYRVSDEDGQILIKAGAAVAVEDDNKPAPEVERTVATDDAENATAPVSKRQRAK